VPYTANITWFRDGTPIPGATGSTITVATTGSYYVQGAPGLCPNLITGLGLSVNLEFEPVVQPVITQTILGALCAMPANAQYEWSLNGVVIPGATSACYEPTVGGDYTVRALPAGECDRPSEPFTYIITGVADVEDAQPLTITMDPANGLLTVQWTGALEPGTSWRIVDVQGRTLRSGALPTHGPARAEVAGLPQGVHLFQAMQHDRPLAPATRFVVGW